ncbi:MAG: phosphohydrolase [Deltaproteobacteria bacterium]|nr:MAG: phosphohydrolase [Deltaproteobacteria bacterium]
MNSPLDPIRAYARTCFGGSRVSHDWEHTCRVVRLALRIGKELGADLDVVAAAAYLHDVARPLQDRSEGALCHAEEGARMAAVFLRDYGIHPEKQESIIHCIRTHRFRGQMRPETLEAKVLFDADKLDAIGAIGIARAFQFAGEVGARLHNKSRDLQRTQAYSVEDTGYREFRVKLSRIKDRMLTPPGRRMALARHAFMERFFERFLKEHEGVL